MSGMADQVLKAIDHGGGQACDVAGVIRELNAAGYVIVPREPTKSMIEAAWADALAEDAAGVWREMIGEVVKCR
jgi:hypothetical protein